MRLEHWLYTVPLRLRSLFRRNRVEQELNEELRYHVELKTEEYLGKGLGAEDARSAALRDMNGLEQRKEECRDARRTNFIESVVQDVCYGARMLRRAPGFTVVAVTVLALGIGANSAVFTVVNGVLLQPMSFPEPERLVLVSYRPHTGPFRSGPSLTERDYLEFREQSLLYENLASFAGSTATLTRAGDPVRLPLATVTSDFFTVLRVHPALGRSFILEEEHAGRDRVAVISDSLWRDRFGGDPEILKRSISLDGLPHTVIGVMPPTFRFPYDADVWTPMAIEIDPGNSMLRPVLGRLKPGISLAQAQTEIKTVATRFSTQEDRSGWVAQVVPLKELLVRDIRTSLVVFAGAVGFVLLIACANVANLLLARAAGREQEVAVRAALGAGRQRLVRQLLTESMLISLIGGLAGILLALWGVPALIALAPPKTIPRLDMIRVDRWVLAFTLAISLLSGILFGLTPAWQLLRRRMRFSPGLGGRSVTLRNEGVRGILVISEVALALILLAGAGLMLRSFLRLRAIDPGFRADDVVTMTVELPDSVYRTASRKQTFYQQTLSRLSGLPGVLSAGMVNWRPLGSLMIRGDFKLEGGRRLPPGYLVVKPCISPGYFGVMGIRLLGGRDFDERDDATAPGVAIVSHSVAQTLWPGEDPMGKRVSMKDNPKPADWLTIVGVVTDIQQEPLTRKPDPAIYQCYLQVGSTFFLSRMTFALRTSLDPTAVASTLRTVLREVDKDQPATIASMNDLVAATSAEPAFQARLLAVFSLLALALAVVGIYGVLAYSVAQRGHEIGIRMALGARSSDVLRMMLRRTLILMSVGIALGTTGALALTGVLSKLLFEIQPHDPPTLAGVILIVMVATSTAGLIPAYRATRLDPVSVLRAE
jgi:predicted permease